AEEIKQHIAILPAVHKLAEGGYDGKGVQVIEDEKAIPLGFNAPSVLEAKVKIAKELALIVGMNAAGETVIYPPAEMIFDPVYNLLDYQLSPAKLEERQLWKAEAIARKVVQSLKSPGLFAIELFVDDKGDILVNETAPRVHNSGHHTIEANYSSQYDMLLRIILNYPLGNPAPILPSAIVNLIGAEGYSGEVLYEGLEEVMKMENVFVHLYGKTTTKPGRKMGHVTIISNDYLDLTHKANKIKHTLKVVSK
ncbi:MAG: hypothetical protein RL387_1989, partial [Bacteroidota bacterium]